MSYPLLLGAGFLGKDSLPASQLEYSSRSPIDGAPLTQFSSIQASLYGDVLARCEAAFKLFRLIPAPRRGEWIRRFGQWVREHKPELAHTITLEVGKTTQEALGEVQEVIDICDFAVGLSRQLHGLTIASERPSHRLMEQWHPLGKIAVITAFNFPMAVWAWNACLALVCGNAVIWKPSEQTPLSAMKLHLGLISCLDEMPDIPMDICAVLLGDKKIGEQLAEDKKITLVSATGSCIMGREIATKVGARLGRSLLELGGNNAAIIAPSANIELAVRGIVFSAVGTTGQRCTTLRRLIVHESILDMVVARLIRAYHSLKIGDPSQPENLIGPLISEKSFHAMQTALLEAEFQGGKILYGGQRIFDSVPEHGFYVMPAIVEANVEMDSVAKEVFAPILYVMPYRTLEHAIEMNNAVAQGLSSAIFTQNLLEAERFTCADGSDCGIANVNIGTSGAEIGGAFGGEKDTGGGRESGSDAWKNYMRRATNAINYGQNLPLAQGVRFDLGESSA